MIISCLFACLLFHFICSCNIGYAGALSLFPYGSLLVFLVLGDGGRMGRVGGSLAWLVVARSHFSLLGRCSLASSFAWSAEIASEILHWTSPGSWTLACSFGAVSTRILITHFHIGLRDLTFEYVSVRIWWTWFSPSGCIA